MVERAPGSRTRVAVDGELLRAFGRELPSGASLYDEGARTGAFYVVVRGHVVLEAADEDGGTAAVHVAGPGQAVGVFAAFAGAAAPSSARAIEASTVLAVPVERALALFGRAPALAVDIIREFSELGREPRRAPQRMANGGVSPLTPMATASSEEADEPSEPDSAPDIVELPGAFDEELFFRTTYTCPVSGTVFAQLRTRAGAMRPLGRESDFHIAYSGVDPTHYAMLVCPRCGFAAYADGFSRLAESELERVRAAQRRRGEYTVGNLCGERSADEAMQALRLGIVAYEARGASPRRIASLYHRMAWIERERGGHERELALLAQACDLYVDAYEGDVNLTDEAAMRAAYIIGDLQLRLGRAQEAFTWLMSCLQSPDAEAQGGLLRMARERLQDTRALLDDQPRSA